jgi:hypothetical protein
MRMRQLTEIDKPVWINGSHATSALAASVPDQNHETKPILRPEEG